jgi:drug/metabolite transporter (DMT)-like permease
LPFVAFDSVGNLHLPGVVPLLSVLALGALGTGAAYVLYYRLINDVGPTSASLVTYLVPVFGVLLGWLALGETLGLKTLVGAVLVITGVVVSERGARAARSRAEEATKAAA